jgi:hypothetical protein
MNDMDGMTDAVGQLRAALADRYAVERELGRGGLAAVYLATGLKHHRPVALKVLKPELAAALGPDRFLREIEVTAGLHHPHILPLYDSGRTGGPAVGGARGVIGRRPSAIGRASLLRHAVRRGGKPSGPPGPRAPASRQSIPPSSPPIDPLKSKRRARPFGLPAVSAPATRSQRIDSICSSSCHRRLD